MRVFTEVRRLALGNNPSQPISTTNLEYTRLPFPGNIIPALRLDPVALNALKFYPAPNTDVGPFFRNNYFIDAPETNTANGMIGKVDHSFHERHRLNTELAFSNGLLGAAKLFPNDANPGHAGDRYLGNNQPGWYLLDEFCPARNHSPGRDK